MLPIAMIGGVVFYKWMGYLTFLSPWLIFVMLFITYCKLDFRDLKPTRGQLILLGVQMLLAAIVYLILCPFNHTLAEGVFICVFIPTATAAPVITAMLGGSISFVATYSLICNTVVAIIGPIVLAAIADNQSIDFVTSVLMILSKVAPLLILPMVCALGVRHILPGLHQRIVGHQQLSFYIWAVSLFIIVGSCVSFVISHWNENELLTFMLIIVGALIVCVAQYFIGRRVGNSLQRESSYNMKVSAAQSLMQKNTVLGVWIAMAYMNPLASVGPASYIAWHNLVNSWQLMRHESKKKNNDAY